LPELATSSDSFLRPNHTHIVAERGARKGAATVHSHSAVVNSIISVRGIPVIPCTLFNICHANVFACEAHLSLNVLSTVYKALCLSNICFTFASGTSSETFSFSHCLKSLTAVVKAFSSFGSNTHSHFAFVIALSKSFLSCNISSGKYVSLVSCFLSCGKSFLSADSASQTILGLSNIVLLKSSNNVSTFAFGMLILLERRLVSNDLDKFSTSLFTTSLFCNSDIQFFSFHSWSNRVASSTANASFGLLTISCFLNGNHFVSTIFQERVHLCFLPSSFIDGRAIFSASFLTISNAHRSKLTHSFANFVHTLPTFNGKKFNPASVMSRTS
jgi:hypothetical protein